MKYIQPAFSCQASSIDPESPRRAFSRAAESGEGLFLTLHASMGLERRRYPDPPHYMALVDVLREEIRWC